MENLEAIIELLYKRTPVQQVIKGKIKSNEFDKAEFIKMATSYIYYHSENESMNLLNYFLDIFQESAKRKGRSICRELNVFEPLFYYAQEFLLIRDNEILCRYPRLMEWRRITTELSEDLIVTAFLAGELTHTEMRIRGYSWKTVIGHNNAQLNAVVRRGISENHFHLNGAAPIFQISWLSLMNNVNVSQLGEFLRSYDKNRMYTNIAYADTYKESSFYKKYMQAALIRLLLYCKICGKRFKIGKYEIKTCSIRDYIRFPSFRYNEHAKESLLNNEMIEKFVGKVLEEHKAWYSFREILMYIIDSCAVVSDWKKIWKLNRLLKDVIEKDTGKCLIKCEQVIKMVKNNKNEPISKLFWIVISLTPKVPLEDMRELFFDQSVFGRIWEKRTLDNVKNLLRKPIELIRQQNYLQSLIDVFRLGDFKYTQGIKSLDYILDHLKYRGTDEEKDNFIFSGERWLMYMMLRKIYLNDKEYQEYFDLFYAYLLIKESIRSELIQSNKNVGFRNFQKYQNRKGDLLSDAIYKKEFTRLAVSNSLVSKNIRKIELRIAPENDMEKMGQRIQELDQMVLPDNTWKKNMFYTVHFIKEYEKLPKDTGYIYCRHYQKRQDIERRAYMLAGLREKYPYIGERILGIDAAANEIGCRPEVFSLVFRFLKNHRYRYHTVEGIVKLPQLSATYHVGEDFLDLADGLRAIEEAILFLNLESGDRLGHALALGIDVKEWYQIKHYRIALALQDYLDNLVWVFHKLIQYDIRGFENLKEWIRSEYIILFNRLYKENMQQGEVDAIFQKFLKKKTEFLDGNYRKMDMGIFNYYYAWQLRGDDPKLYEMGYFEEDYYIEKQEEFRVNFY